MQASVTTGNGEQGRNIVWGRHLVVFPGKTITNQPGGDDTLQTTPVAGPKYSLLVGGGAISQKCKKTNSSSIGQAKLSKWIHHAKESQGAGMTIYDCKDQTSHLPTWNPPSTV